MAIEIRIFLGILRNGEIRMHLNQSKSWEEAKLCGLAELEEIVKEEHHYVGLFVSQGLTLGQLKEKELWIKNKLQNYCPKLNLDPHSCYLIPQLFIY